MDEDFKGESILGKVSQFLGQFLSQQFHCCAKQRLVIHTVTFAK